MDIDYSNLKPISSEDFINKLNEASIANTIITGYEIDGLVEINKSNFTERALWIVGCKFKNGITFSSLELSEYIRIESCIIQTVSFTKITVNYGGFSMDSGNLVIFNCEVTDMLSFSSCKVFRNIIISNDCKINNLNINQCEIGSDIFLLNATLNNVWITSGNAAFIFFQKSLIKGHTYVENIAIQKGLSLIDSNFEDDVSITGIQRHLLGDKESSKSSVPDPYLSINNSVLKETVKVSYSYGDKIHDGFQHIVIKSGHFDNGLTIWGSNYRETLHPIHSIHIDCSRKLTGEIGFNNFAISNAFISGANYDAQIIFDNVAFQKIDLYYLSNSGIMQFINVKAIGKSSEFNIENTNVGKTQFYNTDFVGFGNVKIKNSNLTEIISSSVKWFRLSQIKIENDIRESYHENRELFRQLKFAMEKQGDLIQSLSFKQYEMISYRKELSKTKGKHLEKFLMYVSRSNHYGQNWGYPILWAIGFTFLFYIVVSITQSADLSWTFNPSNIKNTVKVIFCNNYGIFFNLLNPTHNIENIKAGNSIIFPFIYFIDYFQRIIMSYFIFQTISAFRKHLK